MGKTNGVRFCDLFKVSSVHITIIASKGGIHEVIRKIEGVSEGNDLRS